MIMALIILYFSIELFIFHNKIILQGFTTLESIKVNNTLIEDQELSNRNNSRTIRECLEDCLGINYWSWFIPTGILFIVFNLFNNILFIIDPVMKYGGYLFSDDINKLKETINKEEKENSVILQKDI
jgi:hypothetical protein